MTRWVRLVLVLVSAGLYAAAFPPLSVTTLAWVGLIPFFHAIHDLRPRAGAVAGLLWGTAVIWGVGYWVPVALAGYYQQPAWFGALFALGASLVFAGSYTAGFTASACWVGSRTRGAPRALLVALLWVVWEFGRARLLTGDPWLLAGYALMPMTTMIQIADLGGVYVLSFIVVLANASLAELLWLQRAGAGSCTRTPAPALIGAHRRLRRTAIRVPLSTVTPAALALVLAYGYGTLRLAQTWPHEPAVSVMIVQGNNDLGSQWRDEYYGRALNDYLRMSTEAAAGSRPDLVVWPESAITFFLAHEPYYRTEIARVLSAIGADLIVGGPHHDGDNWSAPRYYNSAFYMTPNGQIRGRYDKTHLLPFGEYFPLRMIEFLRRRFERVRYFTPGEGGSLLRTRFGPVATVICFEGIFPELVRRQMALGATLLVNLSNDAWLGAGAGPEQHLAMVALRAVENRTWVLRATTTGISAVIDPFGRVRERTRMSVPAALEEEVVPMHVDTVYQRMGDAFVYACFAGIVIVLSALGVRRIAS
jgi:apolipoprotein N-acyltransferase